MEPRNVLRTISTTKWLRTRHIRTSSVSYLHSPQDFSTLKDISVVFAHFAKRGVLDFREFRKMFGYAGVVLEVQDVRALYAMFPPSDSHSVSEGEFRETVTSPGFARKFTELMQSLKRGNGGNPQSFIPSNVYSFLSYIADKVNEEEIESEAMTRLSAILELVKNHKVEMPAVSLPSPPAHKNVYIEEVKQKLKMIDVYEDTGSKSPMAKRPGSRSPMHRRTMSMKQAPKLPFLI